MSASPLASLASRLLAGTLAGLTATTAMTSAMRHLHDLLPEDERYPLPPREITERMALQGPTETTARDFSLAAHFAYGAAVGALLATASDRQSARTGALAGAAVWAASYFGWIPASGILRSADMHPWRRNALMISAHLVWGAVNAVAARELTAASKTMLSDGPLRDAPAETPG